MMRSESTKALGHPSETKLTLGAAACDMLVSCVIDRRELALDFEVRKADTFAQSHYLTG